ncbi:MAG: hypothetical protein LBC64_05430 [Fibromonadaceae bacterium]|nr:hypothetical protein [Fibromonadaceae bacterium]
MQRVIILILSVASLFAQAAEGGDLFEFKSFLALPIGGYSEETGIILGAGMLLFIEPPAEDGSSAGSNYMIAAMSSFKNQSTIENRLILEPNKHWNLLAYLSLQSWPTQYFGVGNNLNQNRFGVYTAKGVRAPISLRTDLFLPESWQGKFTYGPEADMEYISFKYSNNFLEFHNTDVRNSVRLGTGYNLTYSSNEKNDWPRKGAFVQFRHIFFNSKDNNWQSKANFFVWKNLDTRMYIPLPMLPEGVLALGSYLEDFDRKVPFDRLAKPDGIGQLRGVDKGLLADRTSWVLQSELRSHLFWRIKGTLFYEAAKVGDGLRELNGNKWHNSMGIGGRFLVNEDSKTHIRGDLSLINRKEIGIAIKVNEAF